MQGIVQTLNLVKGERVDLTKDNKALRKVAFAMGWEQSKSNKGEDLDPDASAFILGQDGKIIPTGSPWDTLICYNTPGLSSMGITHTGDDRGGAPLAGAKGIDRETIIVDLDTIDPRVHQILLVATLYDEQVAKGQVSAAQSKLNFGQVEDLFIRAYDVDTGQEILKFDLTEGASKFNCMIFGKFYQKDGSWRFQAMEQGKLGDLNSIRTEYL